MSFFDWFRRPRLVSVAEFTDADLAAKVWGRLQDAAIPASVDDDPGLLGSRPVSRVMVEAPRVAEAQRIISEVLGSMRDDPDPGGEETQ